MTKPGWLKEVLEDAKNEVATWPSWMRADKEWSLQAILSEKNKSEKNPMPIKTNEEDFENLLTEYGLSINCPIH